MEEWVYIVTFSFAGRRNPVLFDSVWDNETAAAHRGIALDKIGKETGEIVEVHWTMVAWNRVGYSNSDLEEYFQRPTKGGC